MLSAELLEILWDGVCGSDKAGIMREAENLKLGEVKLIPFTAEVFLQQNES